VTLTTPPLLDIYHAQATTVYK